MPIRKETELYAPVKWVLEEQGYTVRGEVNGCDLVAARGDEIVVVELKTAFNLALVLQGVARQKVADTVCLAVEAPRSGRGSTRWSDVKHLCRRLGLGLLAVHFTRRGAQVEVVCEPGESGARRSAKQRSRLLGEFGRRSGDFNQGGSTGRPIVTAYREEALLLACYLARHGPSSPRAMRAATGCERAAAILQDNVYGWFERVERGVYRLAPRGEEALSVYADVVAEASAGKQSDC